VTDRGKLQQVIVNLVNNAFHAMADGCCLRLEAYPEEAEQVAIRRQGHRLRHIRGNT
jgi:two-component system NtrC family sensor kinase